MSAVVGVLISLAAAAVGVGAVVVRIRRDRRPPRPPFQFVVQPETPPPQATASTRRFLVKRIHAGVVYQGYHGGDAAEAVRIWNAYLGNPKSHPGTLEFWDGEHRRDHRNPEAGA